MEATLLFCKSAAVPVVEDMGEISFLEIFQRAEEIADTCISPHDLAVPVKVIAVDLQQKYSTGIVLRTGIVLCEIRITADLVTAVGKGIPEQFGKFIIQLGQRMHGST